MADIPHLIGSIDTITTYKGLGSLVVVLLLGVSTVFCIFKYLLPVVKDVYMTSIKTTEENSKHLYEISKQSNTQLYQLAHQSYEENRREIAALKESLIKLRNELKLGV